MKEDLRKYRPLVWTAAVLLLAAYLGGYAYSRQQRLSFKYAASRMLFSSQEESDRWRADFQTNQRSMPLDYSDSELQYILFLPIIKIDSLVSGRGSNSPFWTRPYAIPHKQENSPQDESTLPVEAAPSASSIVR